MWVLLILDQLFLLIVGSANLSKYDLTDFQIKKLLEGKKDQHSQLLRRLHKNLQYVKRQQQFELTLAFMVGVLLFTHLITPIYVALLWGTITALVIMVLRRSEIIKKHSYSLFENMLNLIISVSVAMRPLWWVVGLPEKTHIVTPHSKEELNDVITRVPSISVEEKQRLKLILEADEKTAKDIMTTAGRVKHVGAKATLGPIVLSDLEKTGHGYFPVFSKKEGIVGMLNLKQVSDISSAKAYGKVRDIMSEDVVWVPSDMSVFEVAQVFLQAKQYVLLVRNEEMEFAGMITIADILKHTLAIVKN
jgi:CBS domain containing-hemolysin-like protein